MPRGVGRHVDYDKPREESSGRKRHYRTADELIRALIAKDQQIEVARVPTHLLDSLLHVEPVVHVLSAGSVDVTRVNLTQLRALVQVLEQSAEKIPLSRWRYAPMKSVESIELPDTPPPSPALEQKPPIAVEKRPAPPPPSPPPPPPPPPSDPPPPPPPRPSSVNVEDQEESTGECPMDIDSTPYKPSSMEEKVLLKIMRKNRTKEEKAVEQERKRLVLVARTGRRKRRKPRSAKAVKVVCVPAKATGGNAVAVAAAPPPAEPALPTSIAPADPAPKQKPPPTVAHPTVAAPAHSAHAPPAAPRRFARMEQNSYAPPRAMPLISPSAFDRPIDRSQPIVDYRTPVYAPPHHREEPYHQYAPTTHRPPSLIPRSPVSYPPMAARPYPQPLNYNRARPEPPARPLDYGRRESDYWHELARVHEQPRRGDYYTGERYYGF